MINNNYKLNNRITKLETEISLLKSSINDFISYLLAMEKFLIKNKLIDLLIELLTPSKFIKSQEEVLNPPKAQEEISPPIKKKKRSIER